MSGERAQNELNAAGVIFHAVILDHGPYNCDGCAFSAESIFCSIAACMPPERDDGKYAIWRLRVAEKPVEGAR
jgi:hypothetical protein